MHHRLLRRCLIYAAAALLYLNGCGDEPVGDPSDVAQDSAVDKNDVGLADGETPQDTAEIDSAAGDSVEKDAVEKDAAENDAAENDADENDADENDADENDADDPDAPDAGAPDAGSPCPGGSGCPCAKAADCDAGTCTTWSDGKKRCAAPCAKDADCADKTVCDPVDGKDVCVPAGLAACAPCLENSECQIGGGGSCVDRGPAGNYCGTDCLKDDDCADDEACTAAKDVDGKDVKQCLPKSGGDCACSPYALAIEADTMCYAEGKPGCKAPRLCLVGEPGVPDVDGLWKCQPPAASDEVCDDKDNDCDGQVDESGDALCDDDNPCTDDSCDKAKGCVHQANTAKCDDEDACSKDDACAASLCVGVTVTCDDNEPCTDDSCDKAKGCVTAANTAPCDDQSACTEDDACAEGKCKGAGVTCDDGNVCTDESCDEAKGCVTAPNSAKCDDKSACTKGDACAVGLCRGRHADLRRQQRLHRRQLRCGHGQVRVQGQAGLHPGLQVPRRMRRQGPVHGGHVHLGEVHQQGRQRRPTLRHRQGLRGGQVRPWRQWLGQ